MSLLQDLEEWLGIDLVADDDPARTAEFQGRMAAAQASGQGETNRRGQPIMAYRALPQDEPAIGVPAGRLTLDFANGRIRHTDYASELATGDSLDDLEDAEALRSLALAVDAPARVRLDGGPWFAVPVRETATIQATAFTEIDVQLDRPAAVAAVGSTRSTTLAGQLAQAFERVGDLPDTVRDSYEAMAFSLSDLVAREGDYQTGADPVVPIAGRPAQVVVANTSSSANAIDAEIRGRTDSSESWDQLAEATGISQGNNHLFAFPEGRASEIQLRVRNSTNGNQVAAHAQLTGGV